MRTLGHILLPHAKDNPADLQLYVVRAASPQLAVYMAKGKLGSSVVIDPNAQPVSEELAKTLNLQPGEVRKF